MPDPSPDTLQSLANLVCDGKLTPADVEQLEAMLKGNAEAQRLYLAHVRLDGYLRWECGHQTHQSLESPPAPVLNLFSTAFHNTIGFFSQEIPFSLLIATVITCLGLLGGSLIYVTHHQQVADDAATPSQIRSLQERSIHSDLEFVGRITGIIGVTWADTQTATVHGANVPIGRKYELASGLLEITYDTGAKVILQGPVTYKVDSRDGGFLSVGKLTARLEKRGAWREESMAKRPALSGQRSKKVVSGQWPVASESDPKSQNPEIPKSPISNPLSPAHRPQSPSPTFAVRTPTATVTDLGTEFGVEVDKSGKVSTHVFRGKVSVEFAAKGKQPARTILLTANESISFEPGPAAADSPVLAAQPKAFISQMPKRVALPLFNTGANVQEGRADSHWQLAAVSNKTKFQPRAVYVPIASMNDMPPATSDSTDSQWISVHAKNSYSPDGVTYTFRTTFDLSDFWNNTAMLDAKYTVDWRYNRVRAIRLNGRELIVPRRNGPPPFDIFWEVSARRGFVPGINTLEFEIENGSPADKNCSTPVFLRVELKGNAYSK